MKMKLYDQMKKEFILQQEKMAKLEAERMSKKL